MKHIRKKCGYHVRFVDQSKYTVPEYLCVITSGRQCEAYGVMDLCCVNNGSGKGLFPKGTNPLPEPMLTGHLCDRLMANE